MRTSTLCLPLLALLAASTPGFAHEPCHADLQQHVLSPAEARMLDPTPLPADEHALPGGLRALLPASIRTQAWRGITLWLEVDQRMPGMNIQGTWQLPEGVVAWPATLAIPALRDDEGPATDRVALTLVWTGLVPPADDAVLVLQGGGLDQGWGWTTELPWTFGRVVPEPEPLPMMNHVLHIGGQPLGRAVWIGDGPPP
jgi:hypothetical protein